ncbi:hypothetical protein EN871_20205 [bacterium M00.F.Ca.ET.228.01.1.1]|uniref:hypothetical protein n=1 Tax=Paraburkholderia phenoliruptrix TaxID=252970 RepID=UPI001091C8A1|nr:hypothetical protein [Paraburkholderia phenoliruptrix]TGP42504.1 hypothetical protein EN871_20205 [bacterium M00.F.Ca.ET.228.01.1.1]TGS00155.1 hypothetical protein EN834_18390 [bacterium M00.F.Ca.ET.191.01.1.1]TGU04476.1 hypothetical protein EN798_19210 [bacterium M00.F.Ca.ET.155.01.1.1]MBW0449987.1 hypothetical protein [Paraburkholderia phenoliruptrix]MBW9098739.1 hypothetical protein [Paraburkholderia phenoliruptrix]
MLAGRDFHSSWSKTSEYLREARSHLSETAEGLCADEIAEFEELLKHNELEPALDAIEASFRKGDDANWRVLEYIAMAALSMELVDRQRMYDQWLTEARGWKYRTVLPR